MSNNTNSSGIGFTGLLQIIFITLKLCKVIDWSWWWVLSPIWGSVALFIIAFAITLYAKKCEREKRAKQLDQMRQGHYSDHGFLGRLQRAKEARKHNSANEK